MITEFKNGTRYEYEDVPHNVYAEFRLSESQGKYFNSKISKGPAGRWGLFVKNWFHFDF